MQITSFGISPKRLFRWSRNFFTGIVGMVFLTVLPGWLAAAEGWQEEWNRTIEAANREGRVAVMHGGGASTAMRDLIKEGFQKKFPGIKVDLLVAGGRSIAPRALSERRAGRFGWDIYMGGTTTALRLFMPAGVFDPMRPAFILPEVSDPKNWFGGKIDFADDAQTYNLAFGGYVIPPFAFNTRLVKENEIRSFWDLLEPKWQGKVLMFDPRQPGAGLASATFAYVQPSLGKKYLQGLLEKQRVGLVRNYRQLLEEVARGNYYIGIGVHQAIYKELTAKGLPLGRFSADNIKEGSYLTTATASMGLVNRAPHPNAAKVFINWFLGKEAQLQYSKASGYWSRRVDVPQDHLDPGIVPREEKYDSYQANYKEKYVKQRDEIVQFLKTVIKR
ncbi:MAG: extracellular solute-binding protein [Deltaproteobacteria bacterium]|nr:extracellular solute-binding protein [Deltaproteobacteria bacterium]